MSNALANFYAFKFVRLLTQEWKTTDAYEHGIVDENGKLLKKVKQLKTSEEKKAYSRFNRLAFNIRRMLEKVPFGKSSIARYATAVALLREECDAPEMIEEAFLKQVGDLPKIVQLVKEDVSGYTCVFGLYFQEDAEGNLELVEEMSTGGMSGSASSGSSANTQGFDFGVHTKKKKKVSEDQGDTTFAGNAVFNCDADTFQNCRNGKKKYLKYKPFVGEDEVGERIRQYGLKNPKKGIVLKNARSGAMIYLRRGQ